MRAAPNDKSHPEHKYALAEWNTRQELSIKTAQTENDPGLVQIALANKHRPLTPPGRETISRNGEYYSV